MLLPLFIISASLQAFISPTLSVSAQLPSTLARANNHGSGFSWLLCSIHQTQTVVSISKKETWQALSFQVLSPAECSIGGVIDLQSRGLWKGSSNMRPWTESIRNGTAKGTSLSRNGMESSMCMLSYVQTSWKLFQKALECTEFTTEYQHSYFNVFKTLDYILYKSFIICHLAPPQ